MKRRVGLFGALVLLALVVAGCSGLSPAPFDVRAGFSPPVLGFEVGEDDITIAAHNVTFASERGSIGGIVTGYEIQYYDAAGTLIVSGSSGLTSEESLAHEIPPGIACASTVPCSFIAQDAALQRQMSEPLANVVTLPGPVATRFLTTGAYAAQAEGVFFITTDNGRDVEVPFSVGITYPVEP